MLQGFQDERRICDARFVWVHSRCFYRLNFTAGSSWNRDICERCTAGSSTCLNIGHIAKSLPFCRLPNRHKGLLPSPSKPQLAKHLISYTRSTMKKAGRCRAPRQRPQCDREAWSLYYIVLTSCAFSIVTKF